MSEPRMVPEMAQAIADLRELRELASAQFFDLFVFFRELSERGTPVFRAEVNGHATIGADSYFVLYRLSEPVQACLSALRVSVQNGNPDEVVSGAGVLGHREAPD